MSTSQSPKYSAGRRSRHGCLECRQRRKKCDELKPSCGTCVERGSRCTYPPAKDDTTQRKALVIKPQAVTLPRSLATVNRLVEYFHTSLTSLITFPTTPKDNPFSSLILPYTSESQLICTAVESVASAHLSVLDPESITSTQSLHMRSLRMLATQIGRTDLTGAVTEQILIVSLLLIYYEIILGNSTQASRYHLEGAYTLLTTCSVISTSELMIFLVKIFRYFDVMLALSSQSAPLGFGSLFPEQALATTPVVVDDIFGLSSPLWSAMEVLAHLNSQHQMGEDVTHEAQKLEQHLHTIPTGTNLLDDDPQLHSPDLEAMRQIATAYKNSALLMLYSRFLLPNDTRYTTSLNDAYRSAFDALLRICLLSGPMSTVPWPLYTVASLAESASDRIALQCVFDKLFERQQAQVVQSARDAAIRIWQNDSVVQPEDSGLLLLG